MADPVMINLGGSGAVPSGLLPRVISAPIFNRTVEQSAVMNLARKVPLSVAANTSVPVSMDVPLADWVDEAARKPVGGSTVGIRIMQGKKIAVLVPVSREVAMTNPAGLYDQLQADLPTALARGFDYAAIHGKRITDGSAGPFPAWLSQTDKEVVLGTATQEEGGTFTDLNDGETLLVNDNWDMTGYAIDPRLVPLLRGQVDKNGRPLWVDNIGGTGGLSSGVNTGGTLLGNPSFKTRGVAGKLNRQSTTVDQGLRAIAGDWGQAAYGIGMDITLRVSTEASYVDADNVMHNAFQDNLVLLLAEAYYGFVIGDETAFCKYTVTPGS